MERGGEGENEWIQVERRKWWEIIDDIRRSYNLYKRPRFQREGYRGTDFKRHDRRGSFPSAQHLREHPTSPNRNVKSQVFVVPASERSARGGRSEKFSATSRERPRHLQPEL